MRRLCLAIVPLLAALALSACNKANDVLQPAPATQATAAPAGTAAPPVASQSGTPANPIAGAPAAAGTAPAPTPAQAAAVLGKTRLQIAPIVGASVEAATPLTQRLAARAKESGIGVEFSWASHGHSRNSLQPTPLSRSVQLSNLLIYRDSFI